jgi:hypothetical protein
MDRTHTSLGPLGLPDLLECSCIAIPGAFNERHHLRVPAGTRVFKVKAKKAGTRREKESSSAFFQNLRPKFLDWEPPTEQEKALEVKARKDARQVELKRVTDLARDRVLEKQAARRR